MDRLCGLLDSTELCKPRGNCAKFLSHSPPPTTSVTEILSFDLLILSEASLNHFLWTYACLLGPVQPHTGSLLAEEH